MPIFPVLPYSETESNDIPKLFTNIDKETFEFNYKEDNGQWSKFVIKPGETITLPKYKVNYAATHLTKKMMKRAAFEAEPDEKIRKMGLVKWDNEERAKELSAKMVAKNFNKEIKEEAETEDNPLKCNECGFIAKSKFGLNAHTRIKHKN